MIPALAAVLSAALALHFLSAGPKDPVQSAESQDPAPPEQNDILYEPITLEGEAELIYPAEDGNYRLFISLEAYGTPEPCPSFTTKIAPGNTSGYPAQLIVYREGDSTTPVTDTFTALMKSASISAEPQNGGIAMDATAPQYDPSFPASALTSHISYSSECLLNELCWTLVMKNGDTLRLTHTLEVTPIQEVVYRLEDQTNHTFEELQAFITEIEQTTPADTRVLIYLPPVTYNGALTLEKRSISLRGSKNGDEMTTFIGTQSVLSSGVSVPDFQNIRFIAPNDTGILVNCGAKFYFCEFLNCKTGIAATNGGSIGVDGCIFLDNEVGILYDTDRHGFFTNGFIGNIFRDNDIAFWLKMLPNDIELNFADSVFSGNTTDIRNECDHPISLVGATFE